MVVLEKVIIDNFNIQRQEKTFYCGSASMQLFLERNGISATQEEIYNVGRRAERGLLSPTRGGGKKKKSEGLGHRGMIAIAQHYGLQGFVKRHADIDVLKFFLKTSQPVLVNWWHSLYSGDEDDDNGHYSVLVGYEKNAPKQDGQASTKKQKPTHRVFIADPSNEAPSTTYWLDYDTFLSFWYDKTRSKIHDRWMASFYNKDVELDVPFAGMYIR